MPGIFTLALFHERQAGYFAEVNELSEHLFWDVDRATVDPTKHAAWLVKRVLEYGLWRDWQLLVSMFGKPGLACLVTELRCLDPKAFAFCRAWFQLPPESFRCYDSMPSRNW